MQNLKILLEKLLANNVDFVLIGGFAGVVHGSTLVTQDWDICAAITERNLFSLRTALKDVNPRHRMNPNFQLPFFSVPEQPADMKNI